MRNLVVPCVLTPQLPPFAIPHLTPDSHSIPLSFPHWPYPILATFLSMACALKRFSFTSPRKLALTCVKRGFLRTQSLTELHNYPHVHPRCRSAMSMRCRSVMCHAPAPTHHRLLPRANSCCALCPNSTSPTLGNRTSDPDTLSILTLLAYLHSPDALSILSSSPHRPSPILATFHSTTCVLKRFPLTSPRKLAMTCVKRGFLRTSGLH